MNGLKITLAFIAGLGIGSFITWKILKNRNEEVLEVIEYKPSDSEKECKTIKDKPNIMDYYKMKQDNTQYEKMEQEKESEPVKVVALDEPFSISPEEFGEMEGYEKETLWLFADDVLTDCEQNILSKEDVLNSVGPNYCSSIGEFADETGYIRNEKTKTDYEILIDHRKYHEALRED